MCYYLDMWHRSIGTICYGPGNQRAVLAVDQGIADFYFSLIPKWVRAWPQRHGAHVSVVRREVPPNMDAWGRHEGERVEFEYEDEVSNDETYLWLDVRCPRVAEVRAELGLSPLPPWRNGYHLTIGNVKGTRPSPSEAVKGFFGKMFEEGSSDDGMV